MPVFITKSPMTSISAEAIVRLVHSEMSPDAENSCLDSALHAGSPGPAKPGEVRVVPPMGSERRHVLYVSVEGIENDPDRLAQSYREIFKKAGEYSLRSIAIPMFPTFESSSHTPAEIYRIVRRELKNRPADEDLTVYLVLKWGQKLPMYRQLVADVRSYLREVQRQRRPRLRDFLADDSQHGGRFPKRQRKIPEDEFAPDTQESSTEEGTEVRFSVNSPEESTPALPAPGPEGTPFFGAVSESDFVPDECAFSLCAETPEESMGEPAEAADFSFDYEQRDDPLFDPVRSTFTLEEGFAEAVLKKIDEKGLTDPQCYSRANLSRAVFNKLKQSALTPEKSVYSPSKSTALALVIALELSLEEANDLLKKAGFAISHSNKRDIIVEYFLIHRLYDIYAINEVLFRFDLPLLGSA